LRFLFFSFFEKEKEKYHNQVSFYLQKDGSSAVNTISTVTESIND
jgi:hypothetical protein